ncbi:MAG: DUF4351 domain-containing protein, partial [Chamaesiphon sp.]|nr:DUF4351 domain-containing protein [Chamaesiphon sp.]
MSQFPHDKFAKDLFDLLLKPLGNVNLQRTIQPETKFVDIYFEPNLNSSDGENLGLLTQCLNRHPAIFEPFRNPVTVDDIQSCIVKVFEVQQELNRESKRLKQAASEQVKPQLWILTPTLAAHTLTDFGAVNDIRSWGKACPERSRRGVYLFPSHFQAGIIVVHQLPKIAETLWFRLMGKGNVQQNAVAEVAALPASHPYRGNTLDLFLSLKLELEAKQTIEPEERELIMQLSPLLVEKIEAAEERGRQQGRQQGEYRLILRLLKKRVGDIAPEIQTQIENLTLERLEILGEDLLDFTNITDLDLWLSSRS